MRADLVAPGAATGPAQMNVNVRMPVRTSANRSAVTPFSATLSLAKAAAPSAPAPGVVHTPFGTFDYNNLPPCGVVGGVLEPKDMYFFTHRPKEYKNDPAKMAEFSRIYGPQAVAILNLWGNVPESIFPEIVSSAEDRAFFRADGTRAFYSVGSLIMMSPEARSKVVNISTEELRQLAWNNQFDLQIATRS